MNQFIFHQVALCYAKDKDFDSILNLSKVCKLCNIISKSDEIWKIYLKSKYNCKINENNIFMKYSRGYGFITNDKAIINCLLNINGNNCFISSFFIKTSSILQKYCTYDENGNYISFDIDVKLSLDDFTLFGDIQYIDESILLQLNAFLKYVFDVRNIISEILLENTKLYIILKKIPFVDTDLQISFGEKSFMK
jgi:hypothetical protein